MNYAFEVTDENENSLAFKLYILFVISFFIHLPQRIQVLGVLRMDLVLVLMIFMLLHAKKTIRVKESEISNTAIMLITLIVYVIITLPLVRWPGTVLHSGLPDLVKVLVFYYFTVELITTNKRLKILITTFLLSQIVRIVEPIYLHLTEGYWGDYAHVGGGEFLNRLAGGPHDTINPNGLAFVIVSVLPFFHYYLMDNWKSKLLYSIIVGVLIYGLVLTASRTGFLALLLILGGIFLKSKRKLVLVIVSALVASIAYSNMTELQKERYLSLTRSDVRGAETAKGRILGVQQEFEVAMERPLFGHGLGASLEANANVSGNAQIAHNLYTEILQELGFFGLIIFLLFIKSVIQNYNFTLKTIRNYEFSRDNIFLLRSCNAMQVWLIMNILFSFASYGLSSYEWYFFGGLSVVVSRLTEKLRENQPNPELV